MTVWGMDSVVAAAIGVLTVVFLGSLIALIVVCHHKYCRKADFFSTQHSDTRPDLNLINGNEEVRDMELDDVRLHPDIENILANDQWVGDATGLVPHCLAIMKKCHHLTERLVTLTMNCGQPRHDHQLWEITEVARRISPRVDDVVRSMYPPLDARLLEARVTALILSVSHLALVMRTVCGLACTPEWVGEALDEMEDHVQVLREAGHQCSETQQSVPNVSLTTQTFACENSTTHVSK